MEKADRNSNFELLRIIGIFFIIVHHYLVHGIDFNYFNENISINYFISSFLLIGNCFNHVFIFITGYFIINKKFSIKKIIKLLIKLYFYAFSIFIIFSLINGFSLKELFKVLLSIIYGNWFVVYYIILYTLSPVINKCINALSISELKKVIIYLVIVIYAVSTLTSNYLNFNPHFFFITDYMIGAYFRRKDEEKKSKKSNKNYIVYLVLVLIFCLLILGIGAYCHLNFNISLRKSYGLLLENYSIFNFLLALILFLIFKNIKFNNSIINNISKSTLSIYLIHDNEFMRFYIWNCLSNNMNYVSTNMYIFHMICKCLLIFIICLAIDKIVNIIFFNFEEKVINKIILKIEKAREFYENKKLIKKY